MDNFTRVQTDLLHLETRIRVSRSFHCSQGVKIKSAKVVVQLADVRILALGVQHKPRKSFQTNPNAGLLLHPPNISLPRLRYPTPSSSHVEYPNYTPGGHDKRWTTNAGLEEGGRIWVGSLMFVSPATHISSGLLKVP